MVMIRPAGKAHKIAKAVLANKGVKVASSVKMDKNKLTGPYLLH